MNNLGETAKGLKLGGHTLFPGSAAAGLLVCGLASLLGGWFLAGRALRPVGRLIDDAETLGPGDLERTDRQTGWTVRQLPDEKPTLQFTDLAKGMGVPGGKANNLEELTKQLTYAMSQKGPYLIDVIM